MKKSKTTPVAYKSKKQKPVKRISKNHLIRKQRPIHKRIILHPATIFMLLCVGVFLVAWTFRTFAQNITVTASIFAPLPSSPATITYPVSDVHFTTATLTLTGSCPSDSYVELYRNNAFSGLANCGPGVTTYVIVSDLSLGSNVLYAKVFNVTDNEGPQSAQITIWRDQPAQTPAEIPTSTPLKLYVTNIDNKIISSGTTLYTSSYPTVRGTAIPLSYIVTTFHSVAHICSTYADSVGNWSCTLDDPLSDGTHEVNISAKAPSGAVYNYPTFQIIVSKDIAPLQSHNNNQSAFGIDYANQYKVYTSGEKSDWNITIKNGASPFAITVLWGDGETSTYVKSNNDPFVIYHTYTLVKVLSKEYTIEITAIDSKDYKANLQLSALVTFNGARPGSTSSQISNSSQYASIKNFIKHWVWLIWPAYSIVLLMTVSFWLGEREEHTKFRSRFKLQKSKKSKR